MSGNSNEAWFRVGHSLGRIEAKLDLLLSSRQDSEPSGFWDWWDRLQGRLGFIATAYKTFRMVPWGLIFLALVAIWKAALRFFA